MMKGRIAIPIHNERSELIAYAGRWAGPLEELPEGEDRYKLPPGFRKELVLYNVHRVGGCEHLVLVEGFFGVFRLHELGVPAVALMGHTLSARQLDMLAAAQTRRITLMLDGDDAGRRALSAIMAKLAQEERLDARALILREGVEPDRADACFVRQLFEPWPLPLLPRA